MMQPNKLLVLRAAVRRHKPPLNKIGRSGQEELSISRTQEGCDEIQGYLIGRPASIQSYAGIVERAAAAQPARLANP
jgi:hypothetical protein